MSAVVDRASKLRPEDFVLPWASHVDALPNRHPMDNEFESSGEAANWTQLTPHPVSGAMVAGHDVNKTFQSCLYLPSAKHVVRVAPAMPFTVTARLAAVNFDSIAAASDGSLALHSGDYTHPYRTLNVDIDTVNFTTFALALWNAYGSFNSTNTVYNVSGYAMQAPVLLRWVVASGSSITPYIGVGDVPLFTQYAAAINPSYSAITHVGLVSNGARTAWDWVRFSQP